MSRSRKKPMVTISKAWPSNKERSFRHRAKQKLHEIEIDFDPDKDFAELTDSHKKQGSYGTRLGWDIPPDNNEDTQTREHYERAKRK